MEDSECSSTRDPAFSALTYGYQNTESTLSVAVISTSDVCKKFKESLLEYHKLHGMEYNFKLYVHITNRTVSELCNRNVHVDFFMILADPRRADVLEKVSADLSKLPPQVLITGRCVIAVSWPDSILPSMVAACSANLHGLCNDNMLHKIVQSAPGALGEKHLADRLLRLARTSRGFTASGVPNFTGSFYSVCNTRSSNRETEYSSASSESDD